jgi:hypothetical protein
VFCWGLPSCSIPEPMRICSFIPWLYNCDPGRLILYFYLMAIMSNCNSRCFVHVAYSTPSYAYTPFLPLLLLLVLPLVCCCTFRMSWGQAETSKRNGYSPLQSMYISSQMYVDGGSICQAAGAHGLHVAFVLCAAADCFTVTCVKLPCLN